ncbi:MAG: YIP1 family protein [Candidatus Limnocylindria bacterium]
MTTAAPAAGGGILDRAIRAARLEQSAYEEVEADTTATTQAATIVVIGAVAAGIGAGVGAPGDLVGGLIGGILVGLLGWAVYAYVAFLVGTKLMPAPETHADWGQVARTLGFANSPRVLLVLGVIPALFGIVSLVVGIWVLVTTVIALRAALDVSTGRAVGVAIVSFLALIVVTAVIGGLVAAIVPS